MAYSRNQKHRNQSDTNARNHDYKKKNFKRRKRLTRQDYQIPGQPRGVKVPEGSNIEQALQRFRRMMKHTGIIQELKDKRYFVKPSLKRKVEKERAIGLQRKEQKRIDMDMSNNTCWTVIVNGEAR
jgi:small subunit ribosomal protein S21